MRALLAAVALLALASSAYAQERARQNDCLDSFVSRYMRETAPNLNRVFYVAAQSDVALSFDEADALFGRDGQTDEASADRYANQEVSYLIARIERFETVLPLTSNNRRVLAAGLDRPARNAGIVLMETRGGARVIEFTRANRRDALAYAAATLEACPAR